MLLYTVVAGGHFLSFEKEVQICHCFGSFDFSKHYIARSRFIFTAESIELNIDFFLFNGMTI